MNLVFYNFDNEDEVIVAYDNCYIVPRKDDLVVIGGKIYFIITNPCFNYEKNTVWVFAKERK